MTLLARARGCAAVAGALTAPLFLLTAAPAEAAPAPHTTAAALTATDGPCTDDDGVTVVVDATHFGAGVTRRCVEGDPDTSYAALEAAGVDPEHGTGQGQNGPYDYLCRIQSRPSASTDACTGFVPDAPYWAYWVPDETGTDWAYAEEGVDTDDPAPGTTLGFSFGAGTASDPNQMSLTLAQAKNPDWPGQ